MIRSVLIAAIVAAFGGAAVGTGPASAQAPSPAAPAADLAAPKALPAQMRTLPACANSAKVIGVSRIVEIDTRKGPRFGHQQYKDIDFLQDGEVVLTFDDGPLRRHTQPVLDALAAHCTRATFFMVGRMALSDPAMVREIAQSGHTVGTHTWSHRNLRSIGPARAAAELELGVSAVRRAAGVPIAPFFRFPYLADSQPMLGYTSNRNLGVFSIDADAYDYRTQNPADVHRTIVSQITAKRKGIILFHDIQPSTAGALKGLLDELRRRQFKVVHIVPKVGAETVAEYDAYAESEMAKKQRVAMAQPLATRSVVWPIAPAGPGPARAAAPAYDPLPWAGAQKPSTVTQAPAARAEPTAAVQPAPQPRPTVSRDETPWESQIFKAQ